MSTGKSNVFGQKRASQRHGEKRKIRDQVKGSNDPTSFFVEGVGQFFYGNWCAPPNGRPKVNNQVVV